MVANYRCNEMKEEAVGLVKQRLEELMEQCTRQIIEGFGDACSGLMSQALDHYRSSARQYNPEVFEKIEKELEE